MASFFERFIGAARLDSAIYEEIEADPAALRQAVGVVALSSMAASVGVTGRISLPTMVSGLAGGLLVWAAWAAIAYLIGGRIFPTARTRADWGELLRTTGFATGPGILSLLGIAPAFTGFITFVASLWVLLAFAVAVRQALDYESTWRAVWVCLMGWLLHAVMLWGLMSAHRAA
jgi:hypothetical protein